MNASHESFTPYDPADYLGGIEDVATYLEAESTKAVTILR